MSAKSNDFEMKMKYLFNNDNQFLIRDIFHTEDNRIIVSLKKRQGIQSTATRIVFYDEGSRISIRTMNFLVNEKNLLLMTLMAQYINNEVLPFSCYIKKAKDGQYDMFFITDLIDLSNDENSFSTEIFMDVFNRHKKYLETIDMIILEMACGDINADNIEFKCKTVLEKTMF